MKEYQPGFTKAAPQLSKEEILAITEMCYEDPEEFCVTFLPELFPKKMPWMHKGILAITTGRVDWLLKKCTHKELDKIVRHFVWKLDWDDDEAKEYPMFKVHLDGRGEPVKIDLDRGKYTEVIMPRGFSKTTLIGLAVMLYKILYRENKFIVYVSETATAAELQMGNVRRELVSNSMIQLIFGSLKPERNDDLKWTAEFFQTITGISVTARGRGGQIRGLNISGQRPDCILFDDVEDKESVRTEEQRKKTLDWAYSDMMPALPQMDADATIIGLGTVLHSESLLMQLKKDPEWNTIIFGALDRDGEPIWPDNMDYDKIERKKQAYAATGMLASFYREYMSTIRGEEGRPFPGPFIIRPEWRGELDEIGMVCDPAISDGVNADNFAISVAGITKAGYWLVLDSFIEVGVPASEQVDLFFDYSIKYNVGKHGVETIAYQLALAQNIRTQMFRRKHFFVIDEIKHGRQEPKKKERIAGILQPLYKNGFIAHARHFPKLEAQLQDFPDGKVDGPDSLAMTCKLLAPYLGNAANTEMNDPEADEYEPMKEWRQF